MIRRRLHWLCLGLAVAVVGCAPVPVSVEEGLYFDAGAYRTFSQIGRDQRGAFVSPSTGSSVSDEAIVAGINAALRDRGYREGPGPHAHFIVSLIVNSDTEVRRVNAADPDTDYYVPKTFMTDTLVVTLFDAPTGEPIWRGTANTETMVGGALIPESRENALLKAARSVLARVPARQ